MENNYIGQIRREHSIELLLESTKSDSIKPEPDKAKDDSSFLLDIFSSLQDGRRPDSEDFLEKEDSDQEKVQFLVEGLESFENPGEI